jgi:DNA-binding response OmpR family regulator
MIPRRWAGGERILVVEDNHDLRETILSLLRAQGYEPVGARDGMQALDYLKSAAPPALILLDLRMPNMDGWAFRVEQQRDPTLAATPVVVLSADTSVRAGELGADLFLRKPVEFRVLLEAIRSTLSESQANDGGHAGVRCEPARPSGSRS